MSVHTTLKRPILYIRTWSVQIVEDCPFWLWYLFVSHAYLRFSVELWMYQFEEGSWQTCRLYLSAENRSLSGTRIVLVTRQNGWSLHHVECGFYHLTATTNNVLPRSCCLLCFWQAAVEQRAKAASAKTMMMRWRSIDCSLHRHTWNGCSNTGLIIKQRKQTKHLK